MPKEYYQTNAITKISEKDAAAYCEVSVQAIAYHRKKGRIIPVQMKPEIQYDLNDVIMLKQILRNERTRYFAEHEKKRFVIDRHNVPSPFGSIAWEKDESFRLLDLFHNPKLIGDPLKYFSTKQYAVSNYGRVIDLDLRKEVSQQKVCHDYMEVALSRPDTEQGHIYVMTHTLVGLTWCENARHCYEFHHINGRKDDNRPENLLPCFHNENLKADTLRRKWEEHPENGQYKDEYFAYVQKIRELNSGEEEIRAVLDVDDDSGSLHYLFIKKDAYDRLANGGSWNDIKPTDICGEYIDTTVKITAPSDVAGETEKKDD